MQKAIAVLQPIKNMFGDTLSWADLIVLAGHVAVEKASGTSMTFCGGRTDANEGDKGSELLEPRRDFPSVNSALRYHMHLMGLSVREMVALRAQLRSPVLQVARGNSGSWTRNVDVLDNSYYQTLWNYTWTVIPGTEEYTADGQQDMFMHAADLELKWDPEFAAVAQDYLADNQLFLADFTSAWNKVMNADRFDGLGNLCAADGPGSNARPDTARLVGVASGGVVVGAALAYFGTRSGSAQTTKHTLLGEPV
jgi:catalase-peroxidase